jgi:hypothetical protein
MITAGLASALPKMYLSGSSNVTESPNDVRMMSWGYPDRARASRDEDQIDVGRHAGNAAAVARGDIHHMRAVGRRAEK